MRPPSSTSTPWSTATSADGWTNGVLVGCTVIDGGKALHAAAG